MTSFDRRTRGDTIFRAALIAILVIIAILQSLILQRLPAPSVTLKDIREAKDPKTRQVLRSSVPLVDIYGTVEVEGSVDVNNMVDVNIKNEPVQVETW